MFPGPRDGIGQTHNLVVFRPGMPQPYVVSQYNLRGTDENILFRMGTKMPTNNGST